MKFVCQRVMIGKMDMICFPANNSIWQGTGWLNNGLTWFECGWYICSTHKSSLETLSLFWRSFQFG